MDLRLVPHAEPTDGGARGPRRGARPADSAWDGGARVTARGNTRRGGHEARARRHLLLPALQALQATRRLDQPRRPQRRLPPPDRAPGRRVRRRHLLRPARARAAPAACRPRLRRHRLPLPGRRGARRRSWRSASGPRASSGDDGASTWYRSPCLGRCDQAPAALVSDAGDEPLSEPLAPTSAADVARAARGRRSCGRAPVAPLPQAGDRVAPAAPAGRRRRPGEPRRLPRPRRLRRASPRDRARPRGRHPRGEGLEAPRPRRRRVPDGRKWEAVARQPARPHYLVCNADESEPGTFKDRVLMEGDPFARRRGDDDRRLTRPAASADTSTSAASTRWRPRALEHAHRRAPGARLPRRGRHGRGLRVRRRDPARRGRLHLRRGDGDLQLDRGPARRAAQQAAVPGPGRPLRQADGRQQRRDARQRARHLLERRARRSRRSGPRGRPARSSSASRGTSSGPGVYEVPFGATLRELLDLAGGVPDGRALQAVLLGGAAGCFVAPDDLDVPLTFEGTRAARRDARLGRRPGPRRHGRPRPILLRGSRPSSATSRAASACRAASGTVRQEEALARLARASRAAASSASSRCSTRSARCMRDASICGLGQTASSAIESAIGARSSDGSVAMSRDTCLHGPLPRSSGRRVGAGRARRRRAAGAACRRARPSSTRAAARDRHADPLLRGDAHAGERLPGVRRRARGRAGAGAACSRKVEAGMEIRTDSERVRLSPQARARVARPRPSTSRPRPSAGVRSSATTPHPTASGRRRRRAAERDPRDRAPHDPRRAHRRDRRTSR